MKTLTIIAAVLLISGSLHAQLNPMSMMYYQDQYQANASFAGLDEGLYLSGGIRQQWSSIPGAPKTQALTASYGLSGKRVGLGLNLNNDKSGLLRQTRVLATYAYHLPVGDNEQKLNFGLSLGFQDENIDPSDINGDQSDVQVYRYNDRRTYVDGDFGISYTGKHLTLQASAPNLKSTFKQDDDETIDRNIYMAGISYRWDRPGAGGTIGAWSIEPKVMFRGVKGYKNILDAGAQLSFADRTVNLLGMYHSTRNATFGFGMNFKQKLQVLGMYTTETAALRSYAGGNFEVGVRVKVF